MTLGEVIREVKSKQRVRRLEAQEKASFDYILANLIGISIGRVLDGKTSYPPIEEVYPNLFNEIVKEQREEKEDKLTQLSILRFKQFANFHNKKYAEVSKDNE